MAVTLNITINKSRVIDEVQKTAAYVGSKSISKDDPDAYERISTVDADREQLDRYWMEACSGMTTGVSHWLIAAADQMLGHHYDPSRDYHVELSLPSNWNTNLASATKEAVMSYLVNGIAAKWLLLVVANGNAAAQSAAASTGALALVHEHLLTRVRPSSRLAAGSGASGGDGQGSGGDGQGGTSDKLHVVLTQAEYDALGIYDENTIYLIYEDE